jgi:hypothetical protein
MTIYLSIARHTDFTGLPFSWGWLEAFVTDLKYL